MGHRQSYWNGHIDGSERYAGCEHVLYYVLSIVILDMLSICYVIFTLFDRRGYANLGIATVIRITTTLVGMKCLFYSGIQLELCNSTLCTWAHTVVWLQFFSVLLSCYSLGVLNGYGRHSDGYMSQCS